VYPQAAGQAGGQTPEPELFGQIAIYTLLEDRVDDFDRLTRRVVKQVRAQEPDTLVYIVHAVPSAPMQRILYEVYRDRTAYETHKRQPYVTAFEAERRPYVLATNVIELGLQQAKVSPLPSVSDLLSDTGFDLLKDTGFGQPGYGPRPPAGPSGSSAGGGPAPGGPVRGGTVRGGTVPGGTGAGGPGAGGGLPGGGAPGGWGASGGPGSRRP
jgi:quinol monooxygenase YgiN